MAEELCFSGRSLDDSGLSATPRCPQPIIVPQPSDVTRRYDNSSPSSTSSSSSSHESGIKSSTGSSSPEPQIHHHYHDEYHQHWLWQQQQQHAQSATAVALSTSDDVPLDLSVTSSSPWQPISDNKVTSVHHGPVTSGGLDDDRPLSTLSVAENKLPLLSNGHCTVTSRGVRRRHDNDNRLSVLSFVGERSPLLSNANWLLQPTPVFPQSNQYMSAHVMPPTQHTFVERDSSIRLPESAKLLLTSWYETHIRHPYPQPDELSQLVTMTGQSRRKILKWLANRRARTGNTLPHNGSVHPRKIIKIRQLRQLAEEAEPHHEEQTRRGSRQRSSRFLPESVVEGLQRWYNDHLGYPYPTDVEKRHLAEQLGTTIVKVTNWFANKRNRSGHSKNSSVRLNTASPCVQSPLDWRHSLMSFPRSLPASPLVQTRFWNDHARPL